MTRSIDVLTVVGSSVLAAASVVHLYWAGGGRRGSVAVIPTVSSKPVLSPGAAVTITVAALLAVAAAAYLGAAAGWCPAWLFRTGTATAGVVLIARAVGDGRTVGFTKRVTGTAFARLDTLAFTPLCLGLGAIGLAATFT